MSPRAEAEALENLRLAGGLTNETLSVLFVSGPDATRFLHSQLSSDVSGLPIGRFASTAWLDRSGRLRALAQLARQSEDRLLLAADTGIVEILAEGLESAIIADRVELEVDGSPLHLAIGPEATRRRREAGGGFEGHWVGEPAVLTRDRLDLEPVDAELLCALEIASGQPRLGRDARIGQLVNETRAVELAVSFDKGCYLGQETVAKVASRRGAVRFAALLELDEALTTADELVIEGKKTPVLATLDFRGRQYLEVALHRDLRVAGKRVVIDPESEATVRLLPLEPVDSSQDRAARMVNAASRLFAEDQEEAAIELLQRTIAFEPEHADAYEALGVLLGRHERYLEALELMRGLERVDPSSVMAHSNASLFLMKLGRIAEAEDEKALASELGMKKFLADKQQEDAQREAETARAAEQARQEAMFHQVLELDPADSLANFSLGRILLRRGETEAALGHLETVIVSDPGYSAAYLDLGKALTELGQSDRAKAIFEKGVEVAASKGDLMVANQIQAILAG